jgi:S1-C subfamily serine protease
MNFRITLGLGLVIVSGVWNLSQGQQLREAFRKVEQAVVIVRTAQKELAPYPQEGMVSLNGLGSGVLVSSDGKVLTAAHLVEAADAIVVEFGDGQVIPAHVAGTTVSADVALVQLERPPQNLAPATLADSDRAAVGDEIFVVGAPYGLSHTLTAGHISGRYTVNRGVENTTVELFLFSGWQKGRSPGAGESMQARSARTSKGKN